MREFRDAKRPLPVCNHASTQTDNITYEKINTSTNTEDIIEVCENQMIANIHQIGPDLPLISISVANFSSTVLLDTGSSVSIISSTYFNHIKPGIKIKYLSRQVKITTVNSSVQFSSCIQFSFKIQGKNFKHIFYVIQMAEDSTFSIILGYDFIRKFRVKMDPDYKFCYIDNVQIPFINCQSNTVNSVNIEMASNVNNSNVENHNISTSIDNNQQNTQENVNSDQSVSVNNVTSHVDQPYYNANDNPVNFRVSLPNRVILAPGEQVYAKALAKITCNHTGNFVFSPKADNSKIQMHESLHHIENKSKSDSNVSKVYQQAKSNNQNNNDSILFYIFVENSTSEHIHLNKGTHIGFLSPIDDVKSPCEKQINSKSSCSNEVINVITPSPQIIKQRFDEFNINNFDLNHLNSVQKDKISKILEDNFQAFSCSLATIGHTDLVIPDIKFTSDCPIKCLPFPVPQALQAEARRQLQELVEAGIIERNLSNWACPMLLVKKKSPDNKSKQNYRLALDLRLINTIIEGSSYPLPKIQDLISNLAKFSFFTSLDMPSAYHQVDLPAKFQDRLSFATPWATYKFLRVVFGLKTAAQYFQSMADTVIEQVNEEGIVAYQDDFMIGSHNFDDTCNKLQKVLNIFKKNNLTLNPKKCTFFKSKIQYLGFEISHHTVSPITSNITKINSFPLPTSKKHVKKFLGVCGYYRHLIPAYAKIAEPLVKLTSPKSPFVWEKCHQDAFEELQSIFFKHPFLIQPDFSKDFYLNTDASTYAISAILMQKCGDNLLPVSYFSKTLNKAERKYENLKRELMAITKGVLAFKYYLYGRPFFIVSDCKALEHFDRVVSPTDIVSRWLMTLKEYDLKFRHVSGKDNVLADYLSRTPFPDTANLQTNPELLMSKEILPVDVAEQINIFTVKDSNICQFSNPPTKLTPQEAKDYIANKLKSLENLPEDPENEISISTILREQLIDKKLTEYYSLIIQGKKFPVLKKFKIGMCSNVLYYEKNPKGKLKFAMPRSLQPKAMKIAHISHYGVQKSFQVLKEKYFWHGMSKDLENYVLSCKNCMTSKSHRIPHAPLQNNPVATHPGDFISMDLVGPFTNGKQILTLIDRFSRHIQLMPLNVTSSQNVVTALFKYICTHGRPSMIHSDLGKQFTAQIFQDFNAKYGIRLIHSTTAHPQTNGISERINTSIKSTIIALQQDGYSFDNAIHIHQMLYNSSIHSSTKFSPNQIHFGREISSLYDVNLPFNPTLNLDVNRSYFHLMEDLEKLYKKVHDNLLCAQKLQNQRQHKTAKSRNIKVGDLAYIKSSHTFKPRYSGPFSVIEVCGPVNVILQRPNSPSADKFRIHIDRIWISPPRKQIIMPDEPPVASSQGKPASNHEIEDQQSVSNPSPAKSTSSASSSHSCAPDPTQESFSSTSITGSPDKQLSMYSHSGSDTSCSSPVLSSPNDNDVPQLVDNEKQPCTDSSVQRSKQRCVTGKKKTYQSDFQRYELRPLKHRYV